MAEVSHRQVDRSRRVQAALDVLRGYAAARERQRKPVPAESILSLARRDPGLPAAPARVNTDVHAAARD